MFGLDLGMVQKSADPGLRQGRGGAWDNRRCGTCFVTAMALTLSKVVPATSLEGLKCAAAAPTTKPSRRPFHGNSRSYTPQASVFKGVQACRLPTLKPFQPSRRPFHGNSRSHTPQLSVFKGVQACRLPALKPSKPSRRPFHGNSRSYTPQASVFKGVQACRLPALKPSKPSCRPFHGNSRTRRWHLFFRAFKPAVCPLSNPPKPTRMTFHGNSRSYTPQASVF